MNVRQELELGKGRVRVRVGPEVRVCFEGVSGKQLTC